jgi:hypothetical protein
MKKTIVYIILALLIVVVILFLQNPDELSWLRARLGNQSTDYAQYIKNNPNGWYVPEAQKRFDQKCWAEALKGNNLNFFQDYIKQNPDGLYASSANEKIQGILWSQLASTNSVEDYEKYISQNPDSPYVTQVKKQIENIQWEKIKSAGDINDVRKFVEKYPEGEASGEVKNRFETLLWNDAELKNKPEIYEEYLRLFPSGRYAEQAQSRLTQQFEPWLVYIDSYQLYDLTSFDTDYGYIFENQVRNFLSGIEGIKVVPKKEDAVVNLQIGYALSYRDGRSGDDNISIFIESSLRDKAIIKQEQAMATYDIGLHLYLWDIENDCLLAYGCSATSPVPGNATPARTVGRDRFLTEQVKIHVENSILKEFMHLVKGRDGVMNIKGNNPTSFFRNDIGKPQKRVSVKFRNSPISVYHWRDPLLERYIYYQLHQSGIDIARTFDSRSSQLIVLWTKYARTWLVNLNTPLRAYGLWAHFVLYKKAEEREDLKVFEKAILSDNRISQTGFNYGLLPAEVLSQWQNNFQNSYVVGDIIRKIQSPQMND